MLKDILGQKIKVGDIVVHGGGYSAELRIYKVVKICTKQITVVNIATPSYGGKRHLWPYTLCVVTHLYNKA